MKYPESIPSYNLIYWPFSKVCVGCIYGEPQELQMTKVVKCAFKPEAEGICKMKETNMEMLGELKNEC
jgi:hypothetical protein